MGFERLEKNLIDIIKEEQAKLGYRKESIRLYYPLSSLNHFFDSQDTSEEMLQRLEKMPASVTDKLGRIEASYKGERFCFDIPEQGSEYVHEHLEKNEFITELITLLQKHGCTMKEVIELFHRYSEQVVYEDVDNGEFDCLLRFVDKPDDPYYYCFKDEGCHIIYHRFLPADYEDFEF